MICFKKMYVRPKNFEQFDVVSVMYVNAMPVLGMTGN